MNEDESRRVQRALQEEIHLVSMLESANENCIADDSYNYRIRFKVRGNYGNIYDVYMQLHCFSCTCINYLNGHRCKHIYFCLLKVLQFSVNESILVRKFPCILDIKRIKKSIQHDYQILLRGEDNYGALIPEEALVHVNREIELKTSDMVISLPIYDPHQIRRKLLIGEKCLLCHKTMVLKCSDLEFCKQCGQNYCKKCLLLSAVSPDNINFSCLCISCRGCFKFSSE